MKKQKQDRSSCCVHCGRPRATVPYGKGLHIHARCKEGLKVDMARVLQRGKGSESRPLFPSEASP